MNTIKKAINHFAWRFKNGINPTNNDVKALNNIIDFVNEKHKKQTNDNSLFAKLYVIFYGELLRYYDSTIFSDIPQKELHKLLEKPLDYHVNNFIEINQTIEFGHQISKEHRSKHPIQLKNLGIEVSQVEKLDFDETKENLIMMINLALNKYK